jgi:predicted AAA+ superfamily ATPase
MKDRPASIRRALLDEINPEKRVIIIRGARGVGKTRFLVDFCAEHYPDDPSALYVDMGHLFLAREGLFTFIERFYQRGGLVLLLDQLHKYPDWDEELRAAHDSFPSLRFVCAISSLAPVSASPYLQQVMTVHELEGLSFREFVEKESGIGFPRVSFRDVVKSHDKLTREITSKVRPLAYFEKYLEYGFYPAYLQQKAYISFMLRDLGMTIDVDVPQFSQLDVKHLPKLKELLFVIARDRVHSLNISKLGQSVGISRASTFIYLNQLRDARLLTILYDKDEDAYGERKPYHVHVQNPNLLRLICMERVDHPSLLKSFFISHASAATSVCYSAYADCLVDELYNVAVLEEGEWLQPSASLVQFMDMVERGDERYIPLWLAGFLY